PDGARHTEPVDTAVFVEALVLNGEERIAQHGRNVRDLDERAPLESELGDEASVGGEELRGLPGLVVVELLDGGALAGAAHERPTGVREADEDRKSTRLNSSH